MLGALVSGVINGAASIIPAVNGDNKTIIDNNYNLQQQQIEVQAETERQQMQIVGYSAAGIGVLILLYIILVKAFTKYIHH